MKKRYLFLALALALMLFMLAACGNNGECDHEFGKWKVTKEPDCAGPGSQSRECELCGYTETEKIRASVAHTPEVIPAADATCTKTGLTEGTRCAVCHQVLTEQQEVPVSDHVAVADPAVAPTCTETGLTEGSHCEACDEILVAQETMPVVEHNYVESEVSKPSCNADGTNRFTCQNCKDSYDVAVSMPSYSAVDIHNMTEASVGEVLVYDAAGSSISLGSCFVYSSDGVVVTNYHVIEGGYSAKVTLEGITYNVTKVLAYSTTYDLAVLQLNATGLKPLPVCYNSHATGETVYAFGSSQGLTATFSQGIITNANRDLDGVICVQHDAAISSGNSGGPLINRFGEVIGVNTWVFRDSQNLNFAVSVTEFNKLDYSTPMTLGEVAKLETSASAAFEVMKNYILANGDFYAEDNEYTVLMEPVYSDSGAEWTSYYNYDLTYDEIELCLTMDWNYFLYIYMDADGIYGWDYANVYGDYMYGYYDFSDFNGEMQLPYADYELGDYYDDPADLCDWASSMAHILCYWLDDDLYYMGLTPEDLGIYNFG